MIKTRIFDGITQDEMAEMMKCFSAVRRRYKAGMEILGYADSLQNVCVVLSGTAELHCLDGDGNLRILETLESNSVFGELFSLPMNSLVYTAVAKSACEVLFIQHACITQRCERACQHHNQFIHNLFLLSAEKAQMLAKHVSILSQRSLRQKLLVYLEYMALESNSKVFKLPMSLSGLAEYLSADRSAMMRELGHMRRDGLIRSTGRSFELLRSMEQL